VQASDTYDYIDRETRLLRKPATAQANESVARTSRRTKLEFSSYQRSKKRERVEIEPLLGHDRNRIWSMSPIRSRELAQASAIAIADTLG